MATLILTVAGSFVGGPVGGAVGALIGQRVDRAVLGVGKREGPRLTELKVQTSSYGTPVPRLFGTMRVAGTVIWAADLQETRSTSGGKGQPKTTTYSYQASFAVALSSRPIRAVRRIWAEGTLLRGAAGDFKARTGFRVHLGGEDQAADPLIAAAEGASAPAHRGMAYAVFEELALADFGNRIPSLTFEVEADAGEVASGGVMRALADEVADADDGLALGGFAASGSARGVLETLGAASGGWFGPAGEGLAFRTGGVARTVADLGFGGARGARTVAAATPGAVSVAHYDAARDYQAGLQRARLPGGASGGSVREDRVELAAVLPPARAKAVAEAVLARGDAERVRRTVAPGLDAIDIVPGAVVALAGEAGLWRVAQASLEGMAVLLELVPLAAGPAEGSASGGRVLGQADAVAGRTLLHAFETPALDDTVLSAPRLSVVAAGESAGWRRASLLVSADAGASWDEAGDTAAPAVLGTVAVAPGAGSAALADLAGMLEVALAHAGMVLAPADDASLDRGANLALAGDELLQFGAAEPLGGNRWRLSRLLRGRRGTEWAIGAAAAGDRFVLLEEGMVRTIALPAGTRAVRVLASGVGDVTPAEASESLDGASVRPPSVAQLGWAPGAAGEAIVRWVRRSRAGWRWADGADVPLAEESERYLVTVTHADGSVTREERTEPWASVPRPSAVAVCQRGTLGDSRAAILAVPA